MDIRMLTEEDIEQVFLLSRYVYSKSIQADTEPALVNYFYEYIHPERLKVQMEMKKLYLWGRFDRQYKSGQIYLTGVGAMTAEGLITMLYVHPVYQGRKTGKELLTKMKQYAAAELGLKKIYVNPTPLSMESYFLRQGFAAVQQARPEETALHTLWAKTVYLKEYPKRSMPPIRFWLINLGFGLLGLLLGIFFCIFA